MKIATWNVNNVRKRLPQLLEWLARTQPDVVALQELKTEAGTFPTSELEAAGYASLVVGQRTWNGVALLSRGFEPIEIRRTLPGDPADRQARYIEAAINGIAVACLYLPNGNPVPSPNFDYKLAWFERFNAHARTLLDEGGDVVLAGDFNVVPTNADIYNAGSWRFDAVLQPETRDAWQRLLAQGWIDAARRLHPDERHLYTFWVNEDAFRRNAGFRMDFLLLSPGLASRLRRSEVDAPHRGRDKPSDHAPVWIELDDE